MVLGGGSSAPNTKIGYRVTSHVLEIVKNRLGDLKIIYLGLFAFLGHLEAKICHFRFSEGLGGGVQGPKY